MTHSKQQGRVLLAYLNKKDKAVCQKWETAAGMAVRVGLSHWNTIYATICDRICSTVDRRAECVSRFRSLLLQ